MREKEFINIIKTTLNSPYIGDDCANLKDLGIVITQDSLVEDVHFKMEFTSPYELGYKSVAVNISDVCASGASPAYITISLSLPNNINNDFIEQFYQGAKDGAGKAQIVGGDITGADKIFISITAVGKTQNRNISSRSSANIGQKIVISGLHGSSAAGLKLLMGEKYPNLTADEKYELIKAHLMPEAQLEFSKEIAQTQKTPYAMMDTSDGLADALFAISQASGVMLEIDFEKIPRSQSIKKFSNYTDLILYGGEDYGLLATVDNADGMTVIGEVKAGQGIKINYTNKSEILTKSDIEKKLYNHFKE